MKGNFKGLSIDEGYGLIEFVIFLQKYFLPNIFVI